MNKNPLPEKATDNNSWMEGPDSLWNCQCSAGEVKFPVHNLLISASVSCDTGLFSRMKFWWTSRGDETIIYGVKGILTWKLLRQFLFNVLVLFIVLKIAHNFRSQVYLIRNIICWAKRTPKKLFLVKILKW